jgi:phenol 2-monooxygenase (NADPH)
VLTSCHGFQYEFERRKYAEDLINSDKKFSALFSGKPRTDENQDGVTQEDLAQ